jgi:hypothetical protein
MGSFLMTRAAQLPHDAHWDRRAHAATPQRRRPKGRALAAAVFPPQPIPLACDRWASNSKTLDVIYQCTLH